MTPTDLRTLCTALGFTAVVLKGDDKLADKARRARVFAGLIEDFCNDSFDVANENATSTDEMIEKLKSSLRKDEQADMQNDRKTLLRLYDRLRQRYAAYADDDGIADRILELLDAELAYEDGAR